MTVLLDNKMLHKIKEKVPFNVTDRAEYVGLGRFNLHMFDGSSATLFHDVCSGSDGEWFTPQAWFLSAGAMEEYLHYIWEQDGGKWKKFVDHLQGYIDETGQQNLEQIQEQIGCYIRVACDDAASTHDLQEVLDGVACVNGWYDFYKKWFE